MSADNRAIARNILEDGTLEAFNWLKRELNLRIYSKSENRNSKDLRRITFSWYFIPR
jgi:hypothetical protein